MKETEQMISDEEQGLLGVSKEQLEGFAKRLKTFIEASADNPYAKKGPKMNGRKIEAEYKKRDKILGRVSPDELSENGVGSIFLVVWNGNGVNFEGESRKPMEIWLAKGKGVDGSNEKSKKLLIDYVSLGTLEHGKREIKKEDLRNPKSGSWSIYLNSPVILTP